jgi:hypothetical protein
MLTLLTFPYWENASLSSASVVRNERLPTKIFVITVLLSNPHNHPQASTRSFLHDGMTVKDPSPWDMRANQKNNLRMPPKTTVLVKTAILFIRQPTANRIPRRTEVTRDGTWIHFKKSLHQLQSRLSNCRTSKDQSQL